MALELATNEILKLVKRFFPWDWPPITLTIQLNLGDCFFLLKVRLSSWEDCLIRCLTLGQHFIFLSHISACQLWDSSLDAHLHAQNLFPYWLYSLLVPKSFFFCKIQKAKNNSLGVQIHQSSKRTSVVSRQTVGCSPSMHWLPAAFYLLVPRVFLGNLLDVSTHVPHIDF